MEEKDRLLHLSPFPRRPLYCQLWALKALPNLQKDTVDAKRDEILFRKICQEEQTLY
jgi:hypothetical protein